MADVADDVRADLEKQIADLKKEMSKISKSLSARASDAMDDASDAIEEGKGRARQAVSQVRDQAHAAVDVMRENPGTTATVLSTVGLLGFALGVVLTGTLAGDRRR
ncbi:MAG: hypothetical protein QM656_01830 [Paracoccaceae bacterium]